MSKLAIGIDIGGTNMRGALVDPDGRMTGLRRRPRPGLTGQAGPDEILDLIGAIAGEAGLATTNLASIGVGIPGWVDRLTGELIFAPKFAAWQGMDLAAYLQKRSGCPVYFDSDPHVATLGEWWLGAGRGKSSFVMITLGTGIGCGIVIEKQLYTGHHGFAPEFGHMVVAEAGEITCSCGTPGCLESLASGPAIAQAGRRAAQAGQAPLLLKLAGDLIEHISAETIVAAAWQGERAAIDILQHAGQLIGTACGNLISLLEPERVIVGGGLSRVGELLLGPIRQAMERSCYLIARGYIRVELVPAELGDDAGIIGAARLAWTGAHETAPELRKTAHSVTQKEDHHGEKHPGINL